MRKSRAAGGEHRRGTALVRMGVYGTHAYTPTLTGAFVAMLPNNVLTHGDCASLKSSLSYEKLDVGVRGRETIRQ